MGDEDTKPGQAAKEILSKTIRWNDHFYDKSPGEIKKMIDMNNGNGIIYIEFQYYQIGLTNEWLKNISNKIGDPLTVRREILLQRLHGSDLSPYPRDAIEYITETIQQPIDTLFVLGYYQFDIYTKLQRQIPYIVGVDCSTGTASDNNAITIIDPYTVRPVADFTSPYIGETDYENLLIELVSEYIPRAIVVIERNSVGDGIIDHLLKSKISGRLYFDKDRDLMQSKMKESETVESMLKARSKIKTYYGVYTNGTSRETMFSILSRRINENKDDFVSKKIIEDISGLIRTSSGKIEARPGGHDDSIMSYLIALYVYYHGNNLATFGFYRTDLYDGVEENIGLNRPNLRDLVPEDIAEVLEQEERQEREQSYEDIFREAMSKAQEESYNLSKSRVMHSDNYFDQTQKGIVSDDFYDGNNDDMDLSLFDSLNGF